MKFQFPHMGKAQNLFSIGCTCLQGAVLDTVSNTCIFFDTKYVKKNRELDPQFYISQ